MSDLGRTTYQKIDKFPKGASDRKQLEAIVQSVEVRFGELDLFNMSVRDMYELNIYKLREVVMNTVGLENDRDIKKISDQLKKWDYHEFFAPVLYRDILRVESKLQSIRGLIESFLVFISIDHKEYFDDLIETTYERKHYEIAELFGENLHKKEDYLRLKSKFKDTMRRKVYPKYSKLVDGFISEIDRDKDMSVDMISKFNTVRSMFELRVRDLTIINRIHGIELKEVA
jgi:hypothetical protein